MQQKNRDAILFLLFMAFVFIIICYIGNKNDNDLLRRKAVTKGIVTDVDIVLRGSGLWIKYKFAAAGGDVERKRFCTYKRIL